MKYPRMGLMDRFPWSKVQNDSSPCQEESKNPFPSHCFHCLTRWQLPLQPEGLQG